MALPQVTLPKQDSPVTDLTGTMVGRFAVRARLGAGWMGEVYRADDTLLPRSVALKRIHPRLRSDPQFQQRFRKEAERASMLNHHRIAGIYDVMEDRDESFLVMEYVDGVTLRKHLQEPFGIEKFLQIATQCAEALTAAEEKGIVHRDIKPENIMLTTKGEVKIVDFGLAKRLPRENEDLSVGSTGSEPGHIVGTPPYMSPEVLLGGEPDLRSDLFSLGVVFYEMLACKHPFSGDTPVATIDHIIHAEPPALQSFNPQTPEPLQQVVSKLLSKDPSKRYPTATDLLADLRKLEHGERVEIRPLPKPRQWRIARVLKALAVAAAFVALWMIIQSIIPSLPEQKHVAVLPFSALGDDKPIALGLTESVTVGLTKLTERYDLQVVPASEVKAAGLTTIDQARREFGVNLVITGSLQVSGETIRVRYELADAKKKRVLESDTITAAAVNPFAVEDRVVGSILDALEITLNPPERKALEARTTRDPVAYLAFLRGRGHLQEYSKPENIESAIANFEKALERDPQFAEAQAGLGEAYWQKYDHTKQAYWVGEALAACQRAVAIRSNVHDGHTCLGTVYNGTGQYELAVGQFRDAVKLEPTDDFAYRGLAHSYENLGRAQAAEDTYKQAIKLRPGYWAGYSWLGFFYYRQARYTEAVEMFNQVVRIAPDSFRAYHNLGATYNELGRYQEAIQVCERSAAIQPNSDAYSNLGTAYFYLGRFAEAAQAYEKAADLDPLLYLWRGNLGDALYWTPGQRVNAKDAYERAILLAKEALRVNPRDYRAMGYLAYYYAMVGDKKAAMTTLQQAVALAPENAEVRFNAALTHNQVGQPNLALDWLEKALAAGWNPATVRNHPFLNNLHADSRYLQLLQSPKP